MPLVIIMVSLFSTFTLSAQQQDALLLYREGQYQDAVSITLQEIAENERNMNAYSVLGWSLLALERYDDAVIYGKKALTFSPYDTRLIAIVGEAYYRLKNYEQAITFFAQCIELAPEGKIVDEIYYFMGESFFLLKKYRKAEIAFLAALQYNPDSSAWWARLGEIREKLGDVDAAMAAYQRALSLNSRNAVLRRTIQRLENTIE